MKKVYFIIVSIMCMYFLFGCGKEETPHHVPHSDGGHLQQVFLDQISNNPNITAQELAELLAADESLPFEGVTMSVEEGWLNGFHNDITGFQEGFVFAPMISTIPFIGYIFTVEEGTAEEFVKQLQDNANLAWNVCTEADEMLIDYSDDKIFFLMCPSTFAE